MKFIEWREAFLAQKNRHNLRGELLNGSPLYTYKMSALEFAELQSCLEANLQTYLKIYDINDICSRSTEFPALFVLYAANWWQREYDGTGMSWDPIFSSIRINYSDLNSNTRSQMIRRGFSYWNLSLNKDIGNLKFIGNIASQGGLPLKLIASDKNGNLNLLLKRTLKEVVGLAFPNKQSIFAIIEAHQYDLPKSYRQPLIFDLLAEIIHTFIHLKNEANLGGSSDPLEKLNQFNANWRDSFPLPMDDKNAKGVLERFVQEGALIKAERQRFVLKLDRSIKFIDDYFVINSKVNLPDQAEEEDAIKQVFGIDEDFISRMMTLEINNQTESTEVAIRRLAGQNKFRFDSPKYEFKNALSTHAATLKSDAGSKKMELQNADELDEDSPWVFDAEEINEFKFIKMGAGKFKSSKLYVVVHESFQPSRPLNCIGKMRSNAQLVCYVVDADTTFSNGNNELFEIKTNIQDANNDTYVFRGDRLWDVFQRPGIAFRGLPQLNKTIQVTPTHSTYSTVNAICKNLEGKPLNTAGTFGPIHVAVKENGNQLWTSKIAVLPTTAKINVMPGHSASAGTLELADWNISNLKCLNEDIQVEAKRNGNQMIIDCHYVGQAAPEEFINFEFFWPGNPKEALVKLPFPSAGVIAFDEQNKRINKHKALSLNQIYGVRVVSLLNQSNYVELELTLKDTGSIRVEPYQVRIKRDRHQPRLVIRLLDYKEQISDLLYATDQLDARVEFKVRVLGAKDFKLEIMKYDLVFDHQLTSPVFSIKDGQLANFTCQQLQQCEVLATRIDELEVQLILKQTQSEETLTGQWLFPIDKYNEGCWVIHPSRDSSIQFRAMLLPLRNPVNINFDSDVSNDNQFNSLSDALRIPDNTVRETRLQQIIDTLIEDFNHPSWGHIEYLATNIGHLNLTSLDIWRLFAKNKNAMAALAFREGNFPEQLLKRFGTELPFMWELVSVEAWLSAAFYLHKQLLQKWGGNETFAEEYFKLYLGKRIDDLLSDCPSLRVMLEFVKSKNRLSVSKDYQLLINHPFLFETTQTDQLFDTDTSELQKLMQCDEETWPNAFHLEIKAEKLGEHAALFCKKSYDFREPVINLPIIFAIAALTGHYPEWLIKESNYLIIKQMKQFDSDWFATAFDITIARAIIKGYVQL